MVEPQSHSELVLRHRSLGRLRDRLFVQTRQLARQLATLRPDQREEAVSINAEIQQVLLDVEQAEADIVQIQYRLQDRTELKGRGHSTTESATPNRLQRKLEWLSMAMVLVQENPEWSDAKIAGVVERDPSQLSRSVEYKIAARRARGDRRSLADGHIVKDDDTGTLDVEAYSDAPAEPEIQE